MKGGKNQKGNRVWGEPQPLWGISAMETVTTAGNRQSPREKNKKDAETGRKVETNKDEVGKASKRKRKAKGPQKNKRKPPECSSTTPPKVQWIRDGSKACIPA